MDQLRRAILAMEEGQGTGRRDLLQLAGTVYALVDVLVGKGLLTREELAAGLAGGRARVGRSEAGRRRLFVINEDRRDKYAAPVGAEIDCDARMPLCRGVCCTLQASLSEQDLEEGIAAWDAARPFYLVRDGDRRCRHQDRASCGCTIYAQRPLVCRTYSCVDDRRVWLDFARRVPNERGISALFAQESRRSLQLADGDGGLPDPAAGGDDPP